MHGKRQVSRGSWWGPVLVIKIYLDLFCKGCYLAHPEKPFRVT